MRRSFILLLVALSCFAQDSSTTVSLSNGVAVTITHPDTALKISMEPASGNSFYRIFRDENNLAVFAYELEVERTPDGLVRIIAKPATTDFAARFPYADGGKPTPTFSETLESQPLSDGGEFTIPVPTAPELNEDLMDTVQIEIKARGAPSETAAENWQLRFSSLKVYVNGKLASPRGAGATVQGRYVMFYLPGRGAYFFSSEPVENGRFAHIAAVDGANLQFMLDNDMFSCKSDEPILMRSSSGQLWAYHDPNYKPSGNWTSNDPRNSSQEEFFTAASNSLNWWLR